MGRGGPRFPLDTQPTLRIPAPGAGKTVVTILKAPAGHQTGIWWWRVTVSSVWPIRLGLLAGAGGTGKKPIALWDMGPGSQTLTVPAGTTLTAFAYSDGAKAGKTFQATVQAWPQESGPTTLGVVELIGNVPAGGVFDVTAPPQPALETFFYLPGNANFIWTNADFGTSTILIAGPTVLNGGPWAGTSTLRIQNPTAGAYGIRVVFKVLG